MSPVPRPEFTVVRLREGYDIDDVDSFLDETLPSLDGVLPDPGLADRIERVLFTPRRLRGCDDMGEVDRFLDELRALALQGR